MSKLAVPSMANPSSTVSAFPRAERSVHQVAAMLPEHPSSSGIRFTGRQPYARCSAGLALVRDGVPISRPIEGRVGAHQPGTNSL